MCRVLAAVGNAGLRKIIRAALPESFVPVGEALDGESALPMVRDLHPDVLIADAELPFIDGFALSEAVRRAFPWVQLILLSSSDDAGKRRRAEAMGVREYLIKPVRTYELRDALHRAAGTPEEIEHRLAADILRAGRAVPPERREHERSLSRWLETGVLPQGAPPLPRCGKYCRILTFSGAQGAHADATHGILRLLERSDAGLFAIDMPRGPTLAAASDDPVRLEMMAYGSAHTACLATERFTGARVSAQISRQAESLDALREGWLENLALAAVQPENRRVLGAEDDCAALAARAKTYIDENFARAGLSPEQTARILGLTAARLCVLFEQEIGVTFSEYLFDRRIRQAQRLLTDTRMRISAVAGSVGFDDPDYFTAVFTGRTGLSPRSCRRKTSKC